MQKKDAIKWMTEYVIRELNEGREVVIELKKNVVITPFPSCITAQFGTRELLEAFVRVMDTADDCFRKQGKKLYNAYMVGESSVTIDFFRNPQIVE